MGLSYNEASSTVVENRQNTIAVANSPNAMRIVLDGMQSDMAVLTTSTNGKSVNDVDMEKEKESANSTINSSPTMLELVVGEKRSQGSQVSMKASVHDTGSVVNQVCAATKQWKDQVSEEIEMLNKMAQHLGAEVALEKAVKIYQNVIASTRPNLLIGSRKLLVAACLWWAVRVEILPVNIKMITKSFELSHRDLQRQYLVLNPGRLINYSKRAKEDKINLVEKFINRFIQRMNPPLPPHKLDLIHHCINHLMTPTIAKVQPTSTSISIVAPTNTLVKVEEFKSAPKSTLSSSTQSSPSSSMTTLSSSTPSSISTSTLSSPMPTSTASTAASSMAMSQSTSQRPWTIAAAILFKACEMCQCRRSYEEIAALACIDSSTVRSAVKPL